MQACEQVRQYFNFQTQLNTICAFIGAVIASRLSEIPNWNVLLLEAGGDEPEVISNAPALAAYLQGSYVDWGFKTEPMPTACLGLTGGRYCTRHYLAVFTIFPPGSNFKTKS